MTIEWADVEVLSSDFSDVSGDAQTAILDYVNDQSVSDFARRYLAAHYAQGLLDGAGSTTSHVRSEQVGPLRVDYAVPTAESDALDATGWGREYKRIVRGSLAKLPPVPTCVKSTFSGLP